MLALRVYRCLLKAHAGCCCAPVCIIVSCPLITAAAAEKLGERVPARYIYVGADDFSTRADGQRLYLPLALSKTSVIPLSLQQARRVRGTDVNPVRRRWSNCELTLPEEAGRRMIRKIERSKYMQKCARVQG